MWWWWSTTSTTTTTYYTNATTIKFIITFIQMHPGDKTFANTLVSPFCDQGSLTKACRGGYQNESSLRANLQPGYQVSPRHQGFGQLWDMQLGRDDWNRHATNYSDFCGLGAGTRFLINDPSHQRFFIHLHRHLTKLQTHSHLVP